MGSALTGKCNTVMSELQPMLFLSKLVFEHKVQEPKSETLTCSTCLFCWRCFPNFSLTHIDGNQVG